MPGTTIVIPNYNGMAFLENCLESLKTEECPVIVVDNGSSDGSAAFLKENYPQVQLLALDKNYGFCGAVNAGIKASETDYVLLLNNDIIVKPGFVRELEKVIAHNRKIFSVQAKMLKMDDHAVIDDAGDFYNALGWARARGKDQKDGSFEKTDAIFSACAGAALYRRSVFEKIGYFDENHFAYLEDVDLGYRARIAGYRNYYAPKAVVYHKGSGASGSRYNTFKVYHASLNNIYMIYKNMRLWQILLNLPLLFAGWLVKAAFFTVKGLGGSYFKGTAHGIGLAKKGSKAAVLKGNAKNCLKIQLELWKNLFLL